MLTEKKWPSVILTPITVADSVITVSDTFGLHPKQTITLQLLGDTSDFMIVRILSRTELQVVESGQGFKAKLANPTSFSGGTLCAVEQERNVIDSNAGIRAAYAEEPTVALRTTLVDYYGKNIASATDVNGDNRLMVDAIAITTPAKLWDRIELDRDPTTKNLIDVKYYLDTVLKRELALSYDLDEDLVLVEEV